MGILHSFSVCWYKVHRWKHALLATRTRETETGISRAGFLTQCFVGCSFKCSTYNRYSRVQLAIVIFLDEFNLSTLKKKKGKNWDERRISTFENPNTISYCYETCWICSRCCIGVNRVWDKKRGCMGTGIKN